MVCGGAAGRIGEIADREARRWIYLLIPEGRGSEGNPFGASSAARHVLGRCDSFAVALRAAEQPTGNKSDQKHKRQETNEETSGRFEFGAGVLEQGLVDAGAPQESDVPYRHRRKTDDRPRRDARALIVGLRRGWRRARIWVGAAWNVAISALGIAVAKRAALRNAALTTAAIFRRAGRRARRHVGIAWKLSLSTHKSVARSIAGTLRRTRRRVRESARLAAHRSIPLARLVAQTARLRARRGLRFARKGAGIATARSASSLRRVARTATTGLRRGGRAVRNGASVGWDRTGLAVSRSARAVMVPLRYGVRLVREQVAAGRQSGPALDGVAFEVVSGLHGGVRLMLESGEYGIGSTPEADIILRDSGVLPGHAILGVQRGRVRLEAIGGDVGAGRQVISQGHGCLLRLPFELSLGDARMRLSRIETPATGRSRFAIASLAACSAVAVVFTIGLLREEVRAGSTRVATNLPFLETRAGVAAPGRDDGSPNANVGNAPARPVPLIAEATHELADRINAANLQTLRVSVVEGRLAVSGALSPQDAPAWSAIQQWFDQAYRGRLVLTTNIGFGEGRAMPMLQLRAVWFGERPYIITAEGAHFNQGAILDNGWVIQDIGQDRIVLSKKAETVALTYR
jgi:hypothetical protein